MPDDLMTQVRNLLEEGAAPITLDDVRAGSNVAAPVRVKRRRAPLVAAIAGVAAVCAIAVTVAVVARDHGEAVAVTFASAGIDGCVPYPDATGQAFLDVNATDDEINAARAALSAVPGVSVVGYLDHAAAKTQYVCTFFEGDQSVGVRAEDVPPSIAFKSDSNDTATLDRLRAIPSVRAVVTPASWQEWVERNRQALRDARDAARNKEKEEEARTIGSSSTFANAGIDCAPAPDATVQVFLGRHATDEQIDAARTGIEGVPGVTIDRYLDPQAAAAQYACIFPDLMDGIEPTDVPVSFAIKTGELDPDSLSRLRGVPGVFHVETPGSWTDWIDRQRLVGLNSPVG